MHKLYMVNLPYNCTEDELKRWVEENGFHVKQLRIVRDLVAGVSPSFACVQIERPSNVPKAITVLNGRIMRSQRVAVTEIASTPPTICSEQVA